jgi:hypothetical protein
MITKKQLDSDPGFYTKDRRTYFYGNWDYEFDVVSQELYDINDGFGEPQFVCKVTDFDELKRILETNP